MQMMCAATTGSCGCSCQRKGTESRTFSGWRKGWCRVFALEVLLRNAVEDSVAPGLPFVPVATWRSNVSGVGDAYGRASGC